MDVKIETQYRRHDQYDCLLDDRSCLLGCIETKSNNLRSAFSVSDPMFLFTLNSYSVYFALTGNRDHWLGGVLEATSVCGESPRGSQGDHLVHAVLWWPTKMHRVWEEENQWYLPGVPRAGAVPIRHTSKLACNGTLREMQVCNDYLIMRDKMLVISEHIISTMSL